MGQLFRADEQDVGPDARRYGAGDVPIQIVSHRGAFAGFQAELLTAQQVHPRIRLAQTRHRRKDHRVEILVQPVGLQPLRNLVLADEVGDDAKLVAPGVEGLDDFPSALHHMSQALDLAVLEGDLVAYLPHLLLVHLRQEPLVPELEIAALLHLAQGPIPIGQIALLHHVDESVCVLVARQFRHAPFGLFLVLGHVFRNAEGAAQVKKYTFDLLHGRLLMLCAGTDPAAQEWT